ncbi:aspartyl-phosphate phosphatase Spo0E family protein [Brevibacillus sp. HB1.2]|uniref:aspartyl-phosphate phosphatase Spo0E family protein n=1 Tax=Brevibacillus sp. HB1.2 TaxID=2738807 RepID=UPI0015752635|nr:aspartyl-phosphate phosphatase Spo0E family protein [Brevibacillus sp. HB1.2]NTU21559.1 aspartyl-phosphate phosphatase Spo0E family protein [Brevibacillus sp. HB1.2]
MDITAIANILDRDVSFHPESSPKREAASAPKSRCTIRGMVKEIGCHLELDNRIEHLRLEMMELAGKYGLSHDKVLAVSQQLDKYIVIAQNRLKTEK